MAEIEFDLDMELPTVSELVNGELLDLNAPAVPAAIDAVDNLQLNSCLSDFGLVSLTVDEFITVGVEALNKSLVQACKAGVAFWAAQESIKNTTPQCGVESFKEWIAKSGLAEQRVYECIKIAKYYARLPESHRTKILAMGKRQVLLLAKMPQDVIDSAAENGTSIFDEAETMTYDQLRDLLKNAERKNQNLNAELENREAVIGKLKSRQPKWQFDAKTHIVREECLVYQAECELALNSLQSLFDESLTDLFETEKDMRVEQVYLTANVVLARATQLISRLQNQAEKYGFDLPSEISSKHTLTNDEAERWLLDYQAIERKAIAETAFREQRRRDEAPKGPGRPRASK